VDEEQFDVLPKDSTLRVVGEIFDIVPKESTLKSSWGTI
jgi:hypothetical protein